MVALAEAVAEAIATGLVSLPEGQPAAEPLPEGRREQEPVGEVRP